MRRTLGLLMVLAVVVAGCGDGDQALEPPTPELAAELSAQAAVSACATCSTGTVYIRDHLLEAGTLVGDESPMPDVVRERLSGAFDDVEFVTVAEQREVLGDDDLPEDGTVIYVGPVKRLGADVLGIDIGLIAEGDGFRAQTVQFLWDGASWRLTTSEDTGVTVTTSVS